MADLKEYITDYLADVVGISIEGRGTDAKTVDKLTEAQIGKIFVRYITGKDGDKIDRHFLMEEGGKLFAFNGTYYEDITEDTLEYLISETMQNSNVGDVYCFNSAKKITSACVLALSQEKECKFIPDRRYAVFNNCVLDIETGKIHEHSIKYRTDMVLDFDYYPDKRFPFWEEFVQKTVPDAEMRTALQQFCGAFLMDRQKTKIEYICILCGGGQNGKSVLCEAIVQMFGERLVSAYQPDQLFKSSQSMYYLADINGKMANYCDDMSNKDFSGGDFKQFVSGAPFHGRHPYGNPFRITKVPLMLCCANAIPPNTDDSDGYYRRLLPIICPNKVAEKDKDPKLKDKLSTDEARVGIFNWLLEGYRQLVKNEGKIEIGDSIKDVKENIKAEANSLRRWINDSNFAPIASKDALPEQWKPFTEWLKMYKEYCHENGEGNPKSPRSVSAMFKELGYEVERRPSGTWYCIGYKSQVQPTPQRASAPGVEAKAQAEEIKKEQEFHREYIEPRGRIEDLPF